jgi:hypothetical protein
MPLFSCRECGCVENTACANYWDRLYGEQPLLCSECDPGIGQWHGRFPKRSAAGMLIDQEGHLWSAEESLPSHCRVLGVVLASSHDTKGSRDE